MNQELNEFDDPALKQVIRRVWTQESAPERLREACVEGLSHMSLVSRLWSWQGVAAAAFLMLALGAGAYQLSSVLFPPARAVPPRYIAAALPRELAIAIVIRHEACMRTHVHERAAAAMVNADSVRLDLENRLQRTVMVVNPVNTDWVLQTADVCDMGGSQIAHVVFARGRERVSVLSMPASTLQPGRGEIVTYERQEESHAIAGFLNSKGFFAVVGSSGGVTMDDVAYLRDYLMLDGELGCGAQHAAVDPAASQPVFE